MRLFQNDINVGLVRLGRQVVELANEHAGVDEFGPRFIMNGLQDEVQYLIQTHLGMNNYISLRNATHQNKTGTQALPRHLACPWIQIQEFSETALGYAIRNLLEFSGDNLDIAPKAYIDQLDAVLAVHKKVTKKYEIKFVIPWPLFQNICAVIVFMTNI